MSRKQYTIHYIYKITNNINQKFYVGMHSTFNLEDGYFGSGTYCNRSIKKYGKENFSIKILEFLPDRKSLIQREKEIVHKEFIKDPLCMNLKEGGNGGCTEEVQRIRATAGGKANSLKCKNDLAHKQKYIEAIVIGAKRAYKEGKIKHLNRGWSGYKHSNETKEKIGKANSISQLGKNNSQYGKKWINNGIESKKISPEELDLYLSLDWKQGRINNWNKRK